MEEEGGKSGKTSVAESREPPKMLHKWNLTRPIKPIIEPKKEIIEERKSESEKESLSDQDEDEEEDEIKKSAIKWKRKRNKRKNSKTKSRKKSSTSKDEEKSFEYRLMKLQNSTSLRLFQNYVLNHYMADHPNFKLLEQFKINEDAK